MIDPVERKHNLDNLKYVAERIAELEYSIFFGTVLGFQREGNVIQGDDDIDIYVSAAHRHQVRRLFKNSELKFSRFRWPNKSPHFLQGTRMIDGVKTYVDFYFYEGDDTLDCIIEKWNFSGNWKNPQNAMHVPRSLYYPVKDAVMQGIPIKAPHDPEGICAFLYGETWMTPMSKQSQYKTTIEDHRPKISLVTTPES